MKRDMDMIREILQDVENRGPIEGRMPCYSRPDVVYQVALMIDAGLVDGEVHSETMAFIRRLTWYGHDFLDAAKDDTIWNKAKEHIFKPTVSWTFSLLLDYLKREAALKLGLPTP